MTKKTIQGAISKRPHIIDETELNQLMANFPQKRVNGNTNESDDYICSDSLDIDEYYTKHARRKFPYNILPSHKIW